MLSTEQNRSAMRCINVQPHVMFLADLGNLIQRIERADRRCTGGCRNSDDRDTSSTQLGECLIQSLWVHPAALVEPHSHYLLGPDAKDPCRPGHAVV